MSFKELLTKALYEVECYPCKVFVGKSLYKQDVSEQVVDFSKYEDIGLIGIYEKMIVDMPMEFAVANQMLESLDVDIMQNIQVDTEENSCYIMKPNMVVLKFTNRITKKYDFDVTDEDEFRASAFGQKWISKHGYRTWS